MNWVSTPWARVGPSIATAAACVALIAGQAKQAPTTQTDVRSTQVIRVGVDLVQIDATVTDSRGQHVADLTADDFEISQDGRPQRISTFAYVRGAGRVAAPERSGAPIGSSRPLTAGQVRRTIALVVDDLGLSFESTARVRDVLRTFLDKQMQPGDLVAIIRTAAGSGALQQFTSDRRMLQTAVERIRWNMLGRAAPFLAQPDAERQLDAFRNEIFSVGTLGAINYVVRGIAALPGRKSVIVLSDGFPMTDATGEYGRVLDSLRSLVDAANRAGVVIYSVDARGLVTTGPSAADERPSAGASLAEEIRATQDGLGYLADETGGVFVRNRNDIGHGVVRALEDQQGYYLLGYVPDRSTFSNARPRFHRLRVRVRTPGLRVRSRKGFFGRPDSVAVTQPPANRMVAAVVSPFTGADIGLRLSSFFAYHPKTGGVMMSVMHVDARDLAFTQEADGSRSSVVEVLAVTFAEDGRVADQNSRRFSLRLTADAYSRVMTTGFGYRITVPLKRPGPYQLRIALHDIASGKIGSASQFIDAPDVKKGRLALSGLLIEGLAHKSELTGEDKIDEGDPNPTVALRRFSQGSEVKYFCEIYNARRKDGRPQLETERRLYRDGAEVFRTEPRLVPPTANSAAAFIEGGTLQLGTSIPPGNYVLEVFVTDRLANRRASQTIDFEVIPKRN